MSDGLRDSLAWLLPRDTSSALPSSALGGIGPFDLDNPDDTQRIDLIDWDKELQKADEIYQRTKGCECGAWAIKGFENCHVYYCPRHHTKIKLDFDYKKYF